MFHRLNLLLALLVHFNYNYLESYEYNLGNEIDVKILEPKIKDIFDNELGYSFTDDIGEALNCRMMKNQC